MEFDSGSQEPALTETMGQLRQELWKAKDDHNMAIGAISSLQRQMEIQESELRRIRSEKDLLGKQLREREVQLQAMCDKAPVAEKLKCKIFSFQFCTLTEEERQEEITMMMEEENINLQQVVTEQESQLAEQNKLISELQETISQLRAEVVTTRLQLLKNKQTQKEMQSQVEALQHKELQTRVALEHINSKFERYRNKIIQAVFSAEGSRDPMAELTDNEVLEAMQKIIHESQRKVKKGSKVSQHSSDSCKGSPTTGKRKNSIRTEKL